MKKNLLKPTIFIVSFVIVAFLIHYALMRGLRQISGGDWGIWNKVMAGDMNADVIVMGSSRAHRHFDTAFMSAAIKRKCFNLGIPGTLSIQRLPMLKAYLKHNKKPELIVLDLDLSTITFLYTYGHSDPVLYIPYLNENDIYDTFSRLDRSFFCKKYIPLYSFAKFGLSLTGPAFGGMLGLADTSPVQPVNGYYQVDPRLAWNDLFEKYKKAHKDGVCYPVEKEAVNILKDTIRTAQQNGADIILVYSPEYYENYALTKNRDEVFGMYRKIAEECHVEFWDYSNSPITKSTKNFQDQNHMSHQGVTLFSRIFAERLDAYLRNKTDKQKVVRDKI